MSICVQGVSSAGSDSVPELGTKLWKELGRTQMDFFAKDKAGNIGIKGFLKYLPGNLRLLEILLLAFKTVTPPDDRPVNWPAT